MNEGLVAFSGLYVRKRPHRRSEMRVKKSEEAKKGSRCAGYANRYVCIPNETDYQVFGKFRGVLNTKGGNFSESSEYKNDLLKALGKPFLELQHHYQLG